MARRILRAAAKIFKDLHTGRKKAQQDDDHAGLRCVADLPGRHQGENGQRISLYNVFGRSCLRKSKTLEAIHFNKSFLRAHTRYEADSRNRS